MSKRLVVVLSIVLALFGQQAVADHGAGCKHKQVMHESEQREMEADTNGDGKVSYEEFKAARMARMEEHFKRRDKNGDGFIDADEKNAARTRAEKRFENEYTRKKSREDYSEERKRRKKHFYKNQ